jgi:hypothetical protein
VNLCLLGRIRRTYGARFIDGVSFDAWYAPGPFLRAIKKLGWFWVVVLKRQEMDVYQEAWQLSQGQPPDAVYEDRQLNWACTRAGSVRSSSASGAFRTSDA